MQHVVTQIEAGAEQLLESVIVRIHRLAYQQGRQCGHAFTQVRAGRLAGLTRHRGDVEQVIGELEGDAEPLAVATHDIDGLGWAAAEHRAVARSRRDEHTGLVGKDAQVVVDRVDALGHRSRVADLT